MEEILILRSFLGNIGKSPPPPPPPPSDLNINLTEVSRTHPIEYYPILRIYTIKWQSKKGAGQTVWDTSFWPKYPVCKHLGKEEKPISDKIKPVFCHYFPITQVQINIPVGGPTKSRHFRPYSNILVWCIFSLIDILDPHKQRHRQLF